MEAASNELFADYILMVICLVGIAENGERALELCRNLHIIISVDTQDFLNYVARTLHVDAVCRNVKLQAGLSLRYNLHVEALNDRANHVVAYLLSDEAVYILEVELDAGIADRVRINILYLHAHLAACQLLAQYGSLLQSVDGAVGVDATLEAIACVGAQSVAACALANPCRVEICALKHYVLCGVVCARTLASEDACDTHWVLCVANAQVVLAECVLLAVKSDELGAFGLGAYYYL